MPDNPTHPSHNPDEHGHAEHGHAEHGHHDADAPLAPAVIEAFHASGHRVTPQRIALLKLMRAQGGFLDAEELHRLAQLRGDDLSLATVYRALALFKELNLVEGRIVGPEQEREEYRFRSSQMRYTLTCKRCGAIVAVDPELVDAFRDEVTQRLGVTVISAHTCFVGYCPDCMAALEAEDADDVQA